MSLDLRTAIIVGAVGLGALYGARKALGRAAASPAAPPRPEHNAAAMCRRAMCEQLAKTEAPTEAKTEAPTEAPTEAQTEAKTEAKVGTKIEDVDETEIEVSTRVCCLVFSGHSFDVHELLGAIGHRLRRLSEDPVCPKAFTATLTIAGYDVAARPAALPAPEPVPEPVAEPVAEPAPVPAAEPVSDIDSDVDVQ